MATPDRHQPAPIPSPRQAASALPETVPSAPMIPNKMASGAGDPMRIMLGILADLLTTIVAGGNLTDAATRGLTTINENQYG